MPKNVLSKSKRETGAITKRLVQEIISSRKKKGATVVALVGELGAGKTTFVKSFLRAAGVRRKITSPTFLIMRRFTLPKRSKFDSAYHVDAYRIGKKDLKLLGFHDALKESGTVILIEWADRIKDILPKETIWIRFNHGKRENERNITFN